MPAMNGIGTTKVRRGIPESVNNFDCDPNGTLLPPLEVYGFREYCFSSTNI